jgi:hypothetical protein
VALVVKSMAVGAQRQEIVVAVTAALRNVLDVVNVERKDHAACGIGAAVTAFMKKQAAR